MYSNHKTIQLSPTRASSAGCGTGHYISLLANPRPSHETAFNWKTRGVDIGFVRWDRTLRAASSGMQLNNSPSENDTWNVGSRGAVAFAGGGGKDCVATVAVRRRADSCHCECEASWTLLVRRQTRSPCQTGLLKETRLSILLERNRLSIQNRSSARVLIAAN